MPVVLERVLSPAEVDQVIDVLSREAFEDGGNTSTLVGKHNQQLVNTAGGAQDAFELVQDRLFGHHAFQAAVLPRRALPPIFSCYQPGMQYPWHADDALMGDVRADVAVTLFLSEPDSYDGGQLVVDTGNGERSFRLNAGDAIAYEATMLHQVAPVTRGSRLAAVFWVQSAVRSVEQREILNDLSSAIDGLGENPFAIRLRRSYANLVRLWAEP